MASPQGSRAPLEFGGPLGNGAGVESGVRLREGGENCKRRWGWGSQRSRI